MDNNDLGVDVSLARFWSNALMTVEIPMPDKDVVEQALGYVPIVRCEYCKYWLPNDLDKDSGWCPRNRHYYEKDFFCRDGMRRDNNDTKRNP